MNGLSKWTKILGVVLVLSLAVNFFLAGWMGARMMHGGGDRPEWSITRLVQDLPDDRRDAVLAVFEANRGEFRAMLDSLRESRRVLSDVMMAEPYDQAAAELALADIRAKTEAMQNTMHGTLLQLAPNLSPQARADLSRFAAVPRVR